MAVKRTYDENTVVIFDTTLRDGEQSPGATLSSAEKLEIARQLSRLGVDVIEAGFPAASPDDLKAVQRIAQEVGTEDGPTIAGLARAVEGDIRTAWEGVKDAAHPRIHTFLGTSPSHLRMLRIDEEEGLQRIRKAVTLAKSLCDDVEFSPMDAGRTDMEFLIKACAVAVECGATTLNIPDTVGYVTPKEWAEKIEQLIQETPGAGPGSGVIWSVHCHNDLGMATANTLAAVQSGARQVEVTINGIGERAGNTSMEEVVMALHTRKSAYDVRTNVDTTQFMKTSRMVSNYMGMPVQPNKAIVGANAFAHESGIHQDGVLKDAETFEIMTPESVGLHTSRLVLGKHSGRHALKVRLAELGYNVDGDALNQVFSRFKVLADAKKNVTDADLEALMTDEFHKPQEFYRLDDIQVTCGTMGMPTATIRLSNNKGETFIQAGVGTGPVDASYRAVDLVAKVPNTLIEYSVHSVTEGIDALGEVTVRIGEPNGNRTFGGYGADSDVIVASVKAYMAALNRMIASLGNESIQPEGDAATLGTHSEKTDVAE
ncbi:2-isopropylmalate synthase [Phototrophicus methaneseepsis]|uniref:2-isopropylmalate synthase n=1 Tax=Phototrophicus methaneseepsis TaxID=2710758 RepID=A0A7S8ICZ1_9CHLR|nr:2-isopropylmalate synthase [Phototrophicus methaneseepsis]QPC81001.1 2-isopropylmalate synthase [Phototrophicus methaneseepsis]